MNNLQSGFPLVIQQLKALLKKNLLLSWRNKTSSFMQIFASFFFIFIIFGIQKADEARRSSSTAYDRVSDPPPSVSPPIPLCEDRLFVKTPCFDFVWSGNGSSRIRRIVNSIMANNPGRPISSSKVKSFGTKAEAEKWLNDNPMHSSGALHFIERNASVISYGVQVASNSQAKRGRFEDVVLEVQIPLQIAAEREIARSLIGDKSFSWVVSLMEFAHPAMKTIPPMEFRLPPALLATAMFGFVMQMSSLIAEKELKLRQAMTVMGLYDSAYWLSWLLWEGFLTAVSSLFLVLFGMMFQFDVFLRNSFAILFLVFFLFQLNMLGLAFMFSSTMSNSTSSTVVGYCVFIVGLMTQLVTAFGFPYSHSIPKLYRIVWSFFPPNLLAEALMLLIKQSTTSEDGTLLYKRADTCASSDKTCEIITINEINIWLVFTFILWFALAIYFDNVVPDSFGVRKSIFYFLNPGYWTGKSGNKMEENGICSCMSSPPLYNDTTPEDEDVLEEETLVKRQASEKVDDPKISVQIRGLQKTYHTGSKIGCFKCKKSSTYQALKGLWVNLAKDQIFCLLGHNGAGKTTAMNCLTGITPITGGDALIYGHSIRTSIGMSKIRKLLGVCPQFDVLWDSLSGQEHLQLFASIKGIPLASIKTVTKSLLEKMRLTEAARVRTGSYSGGMKRRLSVAIALIGDPKLVVLDEPTTGMDPITRRHVWDVIEDAKKGRAIFLTTHSMEEADVLSDRIGIMAKGKLRCIGTSIRLKSRFGTGFVANVSFNAQTSTNWDIADMYHYQEAVKQFFKDHLDVVPKEENKAFLTYVIPLEREAIMPNFFEDLEERVNEFGIKDIQLGLTTLEEVFLNISRQAELETAMSEGRSVKLTLTSGLMVEIPIGAQIVGIPGSESEENPKGIMVEVYWSQDDSGALCISGHSHEIPIPQTIEPLPSLNKNSKAHKGLVRGFVIDPNIITGDSQN